MEARPLAVALCIATFGFVRPAAAQAQKPVVAVFQIENRARLKAKDVATLTDYIETRLAETGAYRVVPRSELKAALTTKKNESYKACYDEACQIEIGKEVAAEKTLATKISKLGSKCLITTKLFDLRSSASEGAGTATGECALDNIVALLDKALGAATTRHVAARAKAPPPPSGVQSGPSAPPAPSAPPSERSASEGWTPPKRLKPKALLKRELRLLMKLARNTPPSSKDRPKLFLRLAETALELAEVSRGAEAKKHRLRAYKTLSKLIELYPRFEKRDYVQATLANLRDSRAGGE